MSQKRIISPENFPWLDYKRYTFSMGVEKSGLLFLSGESGSQYDPNLGRVVCRGGVVEQIRLAYEKLKTVLEAAGAGFENVVKTVDYIAPQALPEYRDTAEVRREYFKGSWPASTGIVVERLLRPDGLIEVDAVAVLDSKKEAVNPGWPRYDRLTYHPGVRAGDLLCISGITADRRDQLEGSSQISAVDQAAAIYGKVSEVLEEAGATRRHLAKSLEYLTPDCRKEYPSTWEVLRGFATDAVPASTEVAMNRLLRPEALIEVETVAVLGEGREDVTPAGWSCYSSVAAGPAAVRSGKYLFLSGQMGIDHRTASIVGEMDIVAQSRQAYDNIRRVVEAAGGTLADIVKTVEFVTFPGLAKYRAQADVRREVFGDVFPAATGVVVSSLSRPDALIQVDAIAILD